MCRLEYHGVVVCWWKYYWVPVCRQKYITLTQHTSNIFITSYLEALEFLKKKNYNHAFIMKSIWYCTFFNLSIRYLWCSCLGGKSNINCLSDSTSEKSGSNFWVHPLNHAELLFLRLLHADWDPVILLTAHCDPITPTCTLGPHYSHLHTGTLDFYLHTGGPMILLPAHWDHIILPPAHWDPITPTCTLGPPTSTYTLGVPSYAYLYIGTP